MDVLSDKFAGTNGSEIIAALMQCLDDAVTHAPPQMQPELAAMLMDWQYDIFARATGYDRRKH